MKIESFTGSRGNYTLEINCDFAIVGGGISGVCSAIAAARSGIKVCLVTDRPVLGGNASSEVRLWILGATSHMGNNNRWSREGGIIDEILVENMYRNPEGNTIILDTMLLDKINNEPNITLLLNTAVYKLDKLSSRLINTIDGYNSINATNYHIRASYFCDASGDGILGYLSGATFRIGAESKHEYKELFAAEEQSNELLGHSMYFYSKRVDKKVKYVAPDFALKDIKKIPRYKDFKAEEFGCRLWWLEYGALQDTIHDSEKIKWELWSIIYGLWDYVKNSGTFEDVDNLTLEWVSHIPGKRESRRFIGDYILNQNDIVNQHRFEDTIAYGGWAIDIHPPEGIYSDQNGCIQWHSKGIYAIPYRTIYSKDIDNLFLAGRIISTTHIAHGSSRVMATCGLIGQATGVAASIVIKNKLLSARAVFENKEYLRSLQGELSILGVFLPETNISFGNDLGKYSQIEVSSIANVNELKGETWFPLEYSSALILPIQKTIPLMEFSVKAEAPTSLKVEIRKAFKLGNYTPDEILETYYFDLESGVNNIVVDSGINLLNEQYIFICFLENAKVSISATNALLPGILTVRKAFNKAVSNFGEQLPEEGIGIDRFEFWTPQRRPDYRNIAFKLNEPIVYKQDYLNNLFTRPHLQPNCWVFASSDEIPMIHFKWDERIKLKRIVLYFDTDFDHAMESSLMGHPENVMPLCVTEYNIFIDDKLIYQKANNYQTVNTVLLENVYETRAVKIAFNNDENKMKPVYKVAFYAC